MTYNIGKGRVFSIFFVALLLLLCVSTSTNASPKVVTIEVTIGADGNITFSPNPAVADDEDIINWHIEANNWGAKTFTLSLPGPRYPVQPGGDHTIQNPAHCDYVTYDDGKKDFVVMWPPAMKSYTYGGEASQSPENISAYGQIIKPSVGGVWVPVGKLGLLAPYIGISSTITVAALAAAIYVKRVKRRKEKQ